jgi:hypothetical protein
VNIFAVDWRATRGRVAHPDNALSGTNYSAATLGLVFTRYDEVLVLSNEDCSAGRDVENEGEG